MVDHSLEVVRLETEQDFANAIAYFHTEFRTPIIHRDLAAKNIIMDHYGVAKLLNFSPCISENQR